MGKKIVLNILLNIALITLVLSLFWAINHDYYGYTAGIIFALALFIYLKIRLVKSVREMTRKR